MVFWLALLAALVGYFAFRLGRWRRLPEDERERDRLLGSRYSRFMFICCWFLLADFVAFIVSFGHSFDTEDPASWNVWLNTILFGAGIVLLGLVAVGAVVGPFVGRRRKPGEGATPGAR